MLRGFFTRKMICRCLVSVGLAVFARCGMSRDAPFVDDAVLWLARTLQEVNSDYEFNEATWALILVIPVCIFLVTILWAWADACLEDESWGQIFVWGFALDIELWFIVPVVPPLLLVPLFGISIYHLFRRSRFSLPIDQDQNQPVQAAKQLMCSSPGMSCMDSCLRHSQGCKHGKAVNGDLICLEPTPRNLGNGK